jgi:aspartate-semialdehyde dehydrogenase
LRLAERYPLKSVVVQIFGPASEFGPQAIEELQKQTVSLLSFQRFPQTVFGAQLAFNMLPRLGRSRSPRSTLLEAEKRIQRQLRIYLGGKAPLPALRFIQAPVFHSLAFSMYLETAEQATVEAVARELDGGRIHVRKLSEPAPSPVEVAGSEDILVDALIADADHPNGIWIWAVVDNLRLAAINAVEIAENLQD